MRISTLVISTALLAATGPALAQSAAGASDKLKASCAGDYFQFCSGMDPNGPEVAACFRRNLGQMSPACRAAIIESRSRPAKRPGRRRTRG